MYLLAKFDGHRSYGNRNINSYMNSSDKAELTASVRHIERFSKVIISNYNSEVSYTTSRKAKTRRTQAIAKRYAFHANAISLYLFGK